MKRMTLCNLNSKPAEFGRFSRTDFKPLGFEGFRSTTKLLVACLFAYMVVMCVRGENLLAWFAPMVVTVFCANSLFWVIRLFLSRL